MNKLFKNYLLLFFAALSVLVVGCKDDEDPIVDTEPTISSVNPDEGAPGTSVTISGTNLDDATVRFGTVDATTTSNTGSSIVTTVPATAEEGSQQITVTTAGGTATTNFTVLPVTPGEPTITSVDPEEMTGPVGSTVTITGTNLDGAQVFFMNADGEEIEAEIDETSTTTQLVFTIPEGAVTGVIIIRTEGGEVETEEFTIGEATSTATITGVSPTTGGPGSRVTITGTNFTGATGLRVGETDIAAEDLEIDDAGENIAFTIPNDATTGYTGAFTVTSAEGEEVAGPDDVTFTFSATGPGVTSVDEEDMTGTAGDVVTITGRNLLAAQVIFMNEAGEEVQASVDETSTTETLVFTIPDGAVTGPIIIRTPAGEETQIGMFTIEDDGGEEGGRVLFDDAEGEGIQVLDGWGGTTFDLASTDQVASGESSIMINYVANDEGATTWGGFQLGPIGEEEFSLQGYEGLRMSIYGTEGSGNVVVYIKTSADQEDTDIIKYTVDVQAGEWTTVDIPLSELGSVSEGAPTVMEELVIQNTDDVAEHTIYVDNIVLY